MGLVLLVRLCLDSFVSYLSLFQSSSFWFDCLVVVETRTAKFLRGHPVCNEFGLGRFQLPRDIAYFLVKCAYN